MRKWQEDHREEQAARMRAYRLTDIAAERQRKATWRKANPEANRASRLRDKAVRRAKQANVPYEDVDYKALYVKYRCRCGICGLTVDWAVVQWDHIVPIGNGGHIASNLQPAHAFCNAMKGNRSLAWAKEWLRKRQSHDSHAQQTATGRRLEVS
jgi:5-methylcytosine-specific restriction endonuclease McrA